MDNNYKIKINDNQYVAVCVLYQITNATTCRIEKIFLENSRRELAVIPVFEIPDEIDGYKVTKLGNSVEPIFDYGINEISSKRIHINNFVISAENITLAKNAFDYVSGIDTITIKSCTVIPPQCFSNSKIQEVILPENLEGIGIKAFARSTINAIKIPDSCNKLGDCAFMDCPNLKSVYLGKNINSIPKRCFSGCSQLSEVNISGQINLIKSGAFSGTESLKELDITQSIVCQIDEKAFDKGLNVKLPFYV